MSTVQEKGRPLIGITTGARANVLAYTAISYGVWLAGGRPLRISPRHNILQTRNLRGLVISGGSDIDPVMYGEENIASTNLDPYRDRLERECVEMAFASRLPLLGICRGAQMINVVRGGSLYQDVPSVFEGFLPTASTFGKIFVRRKVCLDVSGTLAGLLRHQDSVWVNSLHHQAVHRLGDGLRATAHDDEFGMVQAVEGRDPGHFVVGVQWHPEFMLYASAQRRIFAALVAASSSGGALAPGAEPDYARRGIKHATVPDWQA
jgi:putative glutamine amidotransferase